MIRSTAGLTLLRQLLLEHDHQLVFGIVGVRSYLIGVQDHLHAFLVPLRRQRTAPNSHAESIGGDPQSLGGSLIVESMFGSHRDKSSRDRTATLTSIELQRTRQAVGPGESPRHHDTQQYGGEVVAHQRITPWLATHCGQS